MRKPLPDALPISKRALVETVVGGLATLPGMTAVVLGGSYARGTARLDSDVDLGLYYRADTPFQIDEVAHVAHGVASEPPTVTGFYEWGAWVNGGAWIRTPAGKIDFLYRNLDQVERTIDEAERGIVHHDYPQQPPYGFYSVTYLAETQVCVPLFDPADVLERLKERVQHYPEGLRTAVVNNGLWSAEFTLLHARTFAVQGDVYNTTGCLTRVATGLTQVLFALNRQYYMSDKAVLHSIETFPIRPAGYGDALAAILSMPGKDAPSLMKSVADLEALWQQTVALTGGAYRPKFVVP